MIKLKLSKTINSLIMVLKHLIAFIMLFITQRVVSFAPIAKRASQYAHRATMLASSATSTNNGPPVSYKVGFMFPGQGAQSVGMAGAICNENPAAKSLFEKASTILGYDLLDKCVNGPKEVLDSTVISQPAIFVSSMAALEKLKIDEPTAIEECTVAMGLSLGEYSALCFAGAFSFEDGVRLTKARGEAMQAASDATESGMVSIVGLDIEGVKKICVAAAEKTGQSIDIANYLVDGNYAISGGKAACAWAKDNAASMGARMAITLAVAGAFHTPYMSSAVPSLKAALDKVTIVKPRIPVISNVDALPHYEPNDIKEILAKQVTNPVQWETIMNKLLKDSEHVKSYEIGPGTVCKGIVKRFGKSFTVNSVTV